MSTPHKNLSKNQKLFGKNLKKIQLSMGLSQLDLGASCNLEKTSISRIENRRSKVTLNTSLLLAEALEVSIAELYSFEKE